VLTDYFTRAALREFVGDTFEPPAEPKYSDDAIDAAQSEVIERLEKWAKTAWPNVDPEAETTDGVTTVPRSTVERHPAGRAAIFLYKLPVIEVTSLDVAGTDVASNLYAISPAQASVAFVAAPLGVVNVAYTYGHTSTPATIRRAAMLATASLLSKPGKKAASKLPGNVVRYSTEGATLDLAADNNPVKPWPWDITSSGLVYSFWNAERPLMVGSA
jgi:hypothetical protein